METKYTKMETEPGAAVHAIRSDLTPALRKIRILSYATSTLT
jgi:hypothetical protein